MVEDPRLGDPRFGPDGLEAQRLGASGDEPALRGCEDRLADPLRLARARRACRGPSLQLSPAGARRTERDLRPAFGAELSRSDSSPFESPSPAELCREGILCRVRA